MYNGICRSPKWLLLFVMFLAGLAGWASCEEQQKYDNIVAQRKNIINELMYVCKNSDDMLGSPEGVKKLEHAVRILAEINATESLPLIIKFLRNPIAYVENKPFEFVNNPMNATMSTGTDIKGILKKFGRNLTPILVNDVASGHWSDDSLIDLASYIVDIEGKDFSYAYVATRLKNSNDAERKNISKLLEKISEAIFVNEQISKLSKKETAGGTGEEKKDNKEALKGK